jgi:hypothetical protein
MRPEIHHLSIRAARADALFVSALQRSDEPTAGQVRQAVTTAIRAFGSRGCVERVAQEFGDHPEAAVARMRWARNLTGDVYRRSTPELATPRPVTGHLVSQAALGRREWLTAA